MLIKQFLTTVPICINFLLHKIIINSTHTQYIYYLRTKHFLILYARMYYFLLSLELALSFPLLPIDFLSLERDLRLLTDRLRSRDLRRLLERFRSRERDRRLLFG